jgi:hypothetical protein
VIKDSDKEQEGRGNRENGAKEKGEGRMKKGEGRREKKEGEGKREDPPSSESLVPFPVAVPS